MYIAKKRTRSGTRYFLRQSVWRRGALKSRHLFDLGGNPADYLVYPDDGCAFYVHEDLCDRLLELGVDPDNNELERVFFPFLDPETQRVIQAFSHDHLTAGAKQEVRRSVNQAEKVGFHIFDRRRMHYLRFAAMDQTHIRAAPAKIYRDLLDKSRDEIEQYFMEKENILTAREKKIYPYVIFNVADAFPGRLPHRYPETLPREQVDECFIEAVCRLNADAGFWADLGCSDGLNEYLIRYVCWFFDNEFSQGAYLEEWIREWMDRRRTFQPPPAKNRMEKDEAVAVMGISAHDFSGYTIKTLTRQYRRMARRHHPDHGGDHEGFIRLNRAFETLLARLRSGRRSGVR